MTGAFAMSECSVASGRLSAFLALDHSHVTFIEREHVFDRMVSRAVIHHRDRLRFHISLVQSTAHRAR